VVCLLLYPTNPFLVILEYNGTSKQFALRGLDEATIRSVWNINSENIYFVEKGNASVIAFGAFQADHTYVVHIPDGKHLRE
jgi:hypothetical protein